MALQRRAAGPTGSSTVPPIVHDVLRSPGQPLDEETRDFFEPRFGHDFSRVRVHTDAKAAKSARAVDARAFTIGPNIVFGAEEYSPQTNQGRRLLAHELTHVVQQAHVQLDERPNMSHADDLREFEANRIANAVVSRSNSHGRDQLDTVYPGDRLVLHTGTAPAGLQRNGNSGERSRQSKPKNAPPGTRPIDQSGLDKEKIHQIKDGVGAGPKDWVGISPQGEVITSDGEGNAENHGPFTDYLPREALPAWVWALIAAGAAIGVILLLLTGGGAGVLVFA